MRKKERAALILKELERLYPEAACSLDFKNALELLIATQLAAQCTDKRVNIVTKDLFQKYKTVEDYAGADLTELEEDIRTTGFFRNKAKNIKACCIKLLKEFDGEVPGTLEELLTLPGVGRKTANVVLSSVFGVPGVIVDTHCGRLARRMGFTVSENPDIVERDLMKIIPKDQWSQFSHYLVFHGREICDARKPKCDKCSILPYCDYPEKKIK